MTAGAKSVSRLAAGWAWAAIDAILLALESGGRPRGGVKGIKEGIPSIGGEHILWSGGFDFTNVRYVPEEYYEGMKKGKIARNDVLVVKDGATTGKTGFVSGSFPFSQAAVNEHVFVMRVFEPHIEPKYLFFWMQSPFGQQSVRDNFKGTAQGGINTSFVRNAQMSIAPLPEQQRIVAKIEELFTQLDAGVAALEKAKRQLQRYRRAVLKAAMEGELTREWREAHRGELEPASVLLERILEERRAKWEAEQLEKMTAKGKVPKDDKWKEKYKKPPAPDTGGLSALPDGWVWTRIMGTIESMRNGIYKPKEYYSDDGIACLRMYNIDGGSIVWKDIKRMILTAAETEQYDLRPGDILVNRVNSRELVGKSAVIPAGLGTCVYESKNIRLRLFVEHLESKYVNYWFQVFGRGYFSSIAQQTVGMATINQEQLGSMPIPIPPLLEQRRIVDEVESLLSATHDAEKAVEQNLKRGERLRQSILQRAFEGKLVPQDPTDEPASMLLERIKAEKASRQAPGKSGNKARRKQTTQQMELF